MGVKSPPAVSRPEPVRTAPMKNRMFRCDDATYEAARARAREDGLELAEVIRHYLREYAGA